MWEKDIHVMTRDEKLVLYAAAFLCELQSVEAWYHSEGMMNDGLTPRLPKSVAVEWLRIARHLAIDLEAVQKDWEERLQAIESRPVL